MSSTSNPLTDFLTNTVKNLRTNPTKGSEVHSFAALESVICAQEAWDGINQFSSDYTTSIEQFYPWISEAVSESTNGGLTGFSLVKNFIDEFYATVNIAA